MLQKITQETQEDLNFMCETPMSLWRRCYKTQMLNPIWKQMALLVHKDHLDKRQKTGQSFVVRKPFVEMAR